MKRPLLVALLFAVYICMLPLLIDDSKSRDIAYPYNSCQSGLSTHKTAISYTLPKMHWPSTFSPFMSSRQTTVQIMDAATFDNSYTVRAIAPANTSNAIQHTYGTFPNGENLADTGRRTKPACLSQSTALLTCQQPLRSIRLTAPTAANAPELYTSSSGTLARIAANNDDDDDWTPAGGSNGFDNPGQPGNEYLQPAGTELTLLFFICIYLIISILKKNCPWRNFSKTKP